MEDKGLGRRTTGEAVHGLSFFGGAEGSEHEALGVATLEQGGTVNAREDANFTVDLAEILGLTAIGALALGEDGLAVGACLEVFEDDGDVDIGAAAFAELGVNGVAGLVFDDLEVGATHRTVETEDSRTDTVTGNLLDDGTGFGGSLDESEFLLLFTGDLLELFDGGDDWLDGSLAELEGLDETGLRDLVGGTFDHEHLGLGADIDQVEGAGEHLLDLWVGDEFAIDLGHTDGADRAIPRNVGDGEGGRTAVEHQDVRLIDLVTREQETNELNLIEEAIGEERAARTIAEAGGEDFLFGGTTLTFEETTGETAGRGEFLAVVDGQGEKVLTWAHGGGGGSRHEDLGLALGYGDGAISEFRHVTGSERKSQFRDFHGLFVIHLY